MKHSVFIFTYNRNKLLKRQLQLFKLLDIKSKIYILDGSTNKIEIEKNKKIASEFNIHYFFEQSYQKRFFLINDLIHTPYLTYCADDDLIDPRFYEKGVEFLDREEDYFAVNGRILCIQYFQKYKFLGFRLINHLPNDFDISSKDFIQNIICLEMAYKLGCPWTHYGVRRLESHKLLSKYVKDIKYFTDVEQLEKLSILLLGGVKTLNSFMGLRDYYNQTTIHKFRTSDQDNNDEQMLKEIVKKELKIKGFDENYCNLASNYTYIRSINNTTRKNYLSFKENKIKAIKDLINHYIFNNFSEFNETGIDKYFLNAFRKVF
jgi:glycosyltransferase domain-containing protein